MKKLFFRQHFWLTFLFAFVIFCSMAAFFWMTGAVLAFLIHVDFLDMSLFMGRNLGQLVMVVAIVSVPVGAAVASVASLVPLRPIRELINGMDQLASGDFRTRIQVGPVMRNFPPFVQLSQSFNKMAQELESTEVLRSDFINSISHEFKTPIVSIAGFAKILRRGNLTPEQQMEYLGIIEAESIRLSAMATNVLNLTRLENQNILTNVTRFNLSEQIRSCILLLERKWEKKDLDFVLNFDEYHIRANEEMLKEVWINLLDNAIKFAPSGHTIQVRITESDDGVRVSVVNTGSTIPPEQQKRIFGKFYQADPSHSTEGNGVGLAIVKRIAQLHGGEVSVQSADDVTAFTVTLPN